MPSASIRFAPSPDFWRDAAQYLLNHSADHAAAALADWRVVVPTVEHARLLKIALAECGPASFILPRITTLSGWLALTPPEPGAMPPAQSARLMALYGELRQHAWLKKLFGAKRNTDLLPLAKTLIGLSDEMTQSLLPVQRIAPEQVAWRWQAALEQLTPSARQVLSDEAQLVWTIWQGQLAGNDACALRFAHMLGIAAAADAPLAWIVPIEPDACARAFLDAWAARQPVLSLLLDWDSRTVPAAYVSAWPELTDGAAAPHAPLDTPALALRAAASLEDEAEQAAQTVVAWLAQGKTTIAIVAQDRVVARRIRALLERAQVMVADETGWKLSTTRAAAALAAWFEVIASRAETVALLDLLKSPYFAADRADKAGIVMQVEASLRRANVLGGWQAATAALADTAEAQALLQAASEQAARFAQRKSLRQWCELTHDALDALGMRAALAGDAAGTQVLEILASLQRECGALDQPFSFAEWRALVALQLESADFVLALADRRVVMLPLNGARLRSFDAVLVVGGDAAHLPSPPAESLFFANAVRRELGLETREDLQRQQLRDFAELLCANKEVVLSWQAHRDGEANPVSPWIARLQLALARAQAAPLTQHCAKPPLAQLTACRKTAPAPAAPQLLPKKLSASAYNQLVACPYQFFAARMLGLACLDELSDQPQKRDYGDWLHRILKTYHDALDAQAVPPTDRAALLREISEAVFAPVLIANPAALGFYVRWQKAMPAYLEWANAREKEGWRFAVGEAWRESVLQWPGGLVTLHGCIDRIDTNDAGEWAVLDYKTSAYDGLRRRLQSREDHQLAFYGLLAEQPVAAAHYVALEPQRDKTRDLAADDFDTWQQGLRAQIVDNLRAISQGERLPASGVDTACRYCDVRGLCRKGGWW